MTFLFIKEISILYKMDLIENHPKSTSVYFWEPVTSKIGHSTYSEYPATLRFAQIAPYGRNFGYSRNVMRKGRPQFSRFLCADLLSALDGIRAKGLS